MRSQSFLRERSQVAEAHDLFAGPIRAEPLGSEHLAERAREVARSQELLPVGALRFALRKPTALLRLEGTRRIVTAAHDYLGADPRVDVGPAGVWLLDNHYLIDQYLREVREGLPQGYYRELPALARGVLEGEPRIFELAITLAAHTEGRIEPENVELFVSAVQEVAPLSLGELWALPSMLRLALSESIRRMTLRTVRRLHELADADVWAARIEAASEQGEGELRDALKAFVERGRPLTPTFVSHLLHQLRVTSASSPPLAKLERWIAQEELSAEDASARASQQLALTQMMMANSITSLRTISRIDWVAFVERQSIVEAALRADPSGHYAKMMPATRDIYRHQVERIARRSEFSELQVAQRAVALAGAQQVERERHVGYFLVDQGREVLEQALAYRRSWRERFSRTVLRHPNVPFVGGILVATALALGALLGFMASRPGPMVLIAVFALLPSIEVALQLVNQLITVWVAPQRLPKLEILPSDDGAEIQTAIVVPILLADVATVEEALHNLEVQYLSNPERYLRFVLLGDFTDAASEVLVGDAAILAAASDGIRALNERHGADHGGPFHWLHRPRRYDPDESVWMGWERKRGKLEQLNAFLRDPLDASFSHVAGDSARLRQTRFVITLDADTMLPGEAAAQLIGALAHPLNRPVFDAETNQVVAGYGVLQPRVVVSLPSAQSSTFATLQSGRPGVDPYTTASSDVYQDLYGEGSFSGKGIYDVDAFARATRGRFPERTVLSHDLIEGIFVRAGLVTDVNVHDDYPARYLSYTRRKHRWIRGDWQLLPWLGRRVPALAGRTRNTLPWLGQLKIVDNLRRSLTELAQLLFLVAGWTVLPGSAAVWTLVALFVIAMPSLLSLTLAALRPPFDRSWAAYYAALGRDSSVAWQQLLLTLFFLPHQAWISADAIGRTLWRLGVSRRHLLQWQTAAQLERGTTGSARETLRKMAPATLAITLLVGAALAYRLSFDTHWTNVLAILGLLPVWLAAPFVAYRLGVPLEHGRAPLSSGERATVERHALLHWQFFASFTNAETGWLSPDNVQEDPERVVAMRTSPTNIGLQLLSTVCAHDLGFITIENMLERLERAFDTIDSLPKHQGHLLNWYSLETRAVLEPAYVSTVDSGNLAGHCLALRQACLELARDPRLQTESARLQALADRAYRLCDEMDFSFLYDHERKLFTVGYQPGTRTRDAYFYDLLASESRLGSFVAIAKNEAPVEHWFRLGRTLTRADGETAMVSWSGSMFEYLMPMLVMRSYAGTLLDQTHRGAVRRQRAYGRAQGLPWGVSESAYNVRDRHLTYQYRAFGVPDLALKRGLENERVVAPYATVMALMVEPKRALANLERLEKLGAVGPFGVCDALDYSRPEPNREFALVRTYMAHHIGMGLVALTNMLRDDVWPARFHADPLVRSAELLLQERVPWAVRYLRPAPEQVERELHETGASDNGERSFDGADTSEPHIALLGHAPYTLMISQAGAGYSRYEELAVTRFRADATCDNTGQFCYLKDLTRGRAWSATHQPMCAPAEYYRAVLAPDRATFHRVDGDVETELQIAVAPEDAAEVRRLTVTNRSDEVRTIELTSYGEIVLAPPDADRAHPAFSNLFVETEFHAWCSAITATRRPRSAKDRALICVHVVDAGSARVLEVSCETDRARFVGRGRSTRAPLALTVDGPLSGTTGAVLDPIFALRVRMELQPKESAKVAFTTLMATTREAAFVLADRYHHPQAAQRVLDLAWTRTQVELRELGVGPGEAAVFQELAGGLFYATPALRASADELARNRGAQPLLWEHGISGDWPIVLASIDAREGLATLRQLFAAHHYWRRRGMMVDLVVLNMEPSLYLQELSNEITAGLFGSSDSGMLDRSGGVFVLRRDLLSAPSFAMLRATARVHVMCDGRELGRSIVKTDIRQAVAARPAALTRDPEQAKRRASEAATQWVDDITDMVLGSARKDALAASPSVSEPTALPDSALLFDNGFGGLTPEGNYRIRVRGEFIPPAPWANVVANPQGGFVVSERGAGYSWADSSYFFRLTPWFNDPVGDPMGEVLYLRDEVSGTAWSATPAPMASNLPYTVEHAAGSSSFTHEREQIATELQLGMADGAAVKISRLRLHNRSARTRVISVTHYVEWTLGVLREHTQHQIHTQYDANTRAIFARNYFDPQYAGWVAFSASSNEVASHSGSRRSFIGRNGTLAQPAALHTAALDGKTGAGVDPCGALRSSITLAPGQSHELAFVLGAASSEDGARAAIASFAGKADATLEQSVKVWEQRLSVVRVRTPDPAFDAMINRWSLYQTLACRMWARSAVYQSSGAYGFRDQLQDAMALVYAEPGLARAHILRAASRQFLEGDVQHWWHEGTGRGVRTRFSDDLAWLPYVVAHYVRTTGDSAVLDEEVSFLTMRALSPEEHEIYAEPQPAGQHASLYEHCLRAIHKACTQGEHGLPLMGSGDWNDGMNLIGVEGRGESVWLAWFLIRVLHTFYPLLRDQASKEQLTSRAEHYAAAVETHGWDGAWYRRAYFDDGSALGTAASDECRIDSIAQSWSVISEAGTPAHQTQAMASLEEHLLDREARILMLLTPPFDKAERNPGYIKGYLPGVRENGAQYTHAALWAVLALATRREGDKAFSLFQMLNPLNHARTEAEVNVYKVEPYVVAADVYAAKGQRGRGGWTWYTGSASWLYRVGLEALLGFDKRGDRLFLSPAVPSAWKAYTLDYRFGTSDYEIEVRFTSEGVDTLEVDGVGVEGGIPLLDDGRRHRVIATRVRTS